MSKSLKLKWKSHEDILISIKPSIGREEYLDYMTFKSNDRPLLRELFGPIIGLKEEWEEQGATREELDFSAFRYRCQGSGRVPVNTGRNGGFPEKVLEETDEYKIWKDGLGRTMKRIKAKSTVGLPMDFPVSNMDDWRKIKHFYEFAEDRFTASWQTEAMKILEDNRVVQVSIPGGFDEPRQLMGEERLCVAYYEQPELVQDIIDTISETAFRVLDRVSQNVKIDMLIVHEDMAGKSGPLVGPVQISSFIAPYYRRIWDMLRSRGARIFNLDSDGNINPVLESYMDAGVNCMHPMESAAGMDIVKIRKAYGNRLAFEGGIDKHVLRKSKEDILKELEYKVPPMVRTGGCMLGLDHRIPNGTPLENYKFYLSKIWDIIER